MFSVLKQSEEISERPRWCARGRKGSNSVSRQGIILAEKIEVGVTSGTRVHDGGKVRGKVVCITAILERECKREP